MTGMNGDVTRVRSGGSLGVEDTSTVGQNRRVRKGDQLTTSNGVWANFSDSNVPRTRTAPKPTTNAELLARRQAAVPRGVASATTIFADRAENAYLWDVEGRRYIDFGGGIGVLNTGHRNPEVMDRVLDQLDRFTHSCFQVNPYESYVALAERINAAAPIEGPAKSIFFTTGA